MRRRGRRVGETRSDIGISQFYSSGFETREQVGVSPVMGMVF